MAIEYSEEKNCVENLFRWMTWSRFFAGVILADGEKICAAQDGNFGEQRDTPGPGGELFQGQGRAGECAQPLSPAGVRAGTHGGDRRVPAEPRRQDAIFLRVAKKDREQSGEPGCGAGPFHESLPGLRARLHLLLRAKHARV